MKFFLVLLTLSLVLHGNAQIVKFKQSVKEELIKKDQKVTIANLSAENTALDFRTQLDRLKFLVLAEMGRISKNKLNPLQESSALSQLCGFCIRYWKNSVHSDAKKWSQMQKHLKRAVYGINCDFGLIQSASMTIPLMDANKGRYYYDAKGVKGELNLYKGKRPETKEELAESEKIPLDFFSEVQLMHLIKKELKRKKITEGLRKGTYYCVGISIEVDEHTLFKNAIPRARIVIICGAKRLQLIEEKQKKETINHSK